MLTVVLSFFTGIFKAVSAIAGPAFQLIMMNKAKQAERDRIKVEQLEQKAELEDEFDQIERSEDLARDDVLDWVRGNKAKRDPKRLP